MTSDFEKPPSIPTPPPPPGVDKDKWALRDKTIPKPPPPPGQESDNVDEAFFTEQSQKQEAERLSHIEVAYGEEAVEDMAKVGKDLYAAMQQRALHEINQGGDKEKFAEYLDAMNKFADALFTREVSTNLEDNDVIPVIKGATAALAPEAVGEYVKDAQPLQELLNRRYGRIEPTTSTNAEF